MEYMSISGRDYVPNNINDYCNVKGTVFALHPVNGVLVDFQTEAREKNLPPQMIWYEPRCLTRIDTEGNDGPYVDRILPGTFVNIKNKSMNKRGIKKGVIVLTPMDKCMKNDSLNFVYVNHNGVNNVRVAIKDIEQATFLNENIDQLEYVDIELVNFAVGLRVTVKSVEKIVNAFEYADRNDLSEDHKSYSKQSGKVCFLH